MYEPTQGRILLGPGRVDLTEIPKQHLRKSISYVTQVEAITSTRPPR